MNNSRESLLIIYNGCSCDTCGLVLRSRHHVLSIGRDTHAPDGASVTLDLVHELAVVHTRDAHGLVLSPRHHVL